VPAEKAPAGGGAGRDLAPHGRYCRARASAGQAWIP
jgi:hypothetical protein